MQHHSNTKHCYYTTPNNYTTDPPCIPLFMLLTDAYTPLTPPVTPTNTSIQYCTYISLLHSWLLTIITHLCTVLSDIYRLVLLYTLIRSAV
jgi:hypothetical protein